MEDIPNNIKDLKSILNASYKDNANAKSDL